MKKLIAIIGVGNILMGDDGVGIHAIKYLQKFDWPENVELIDAAVPGATLLYMLEDREQAIVIDCADFKGEPGEILVVPPEKLKKTAEEIFSLHETSLLGTMALAEALNIPLPKITLICIQPKTIKISEKLSPELQEVLPGIRIRILNLIT